MGLISLETGFGWTDAGLGGRLHSREHLTRNAPSAIARGLRARPCRASEGAEAHARRPTQGAVGTPTTRERGTTDCRHSDAISGPVFDAPVSDAGGLVT